MSHSAYFRRSIFWDYFRADSSRGMKPGRRAKDPAMTLTGILNNIDQKRGVAAMSTHEVETIKPALDESINDCKPKVFECASTCVHGGGKGGAMRTYSVRRNRHRKTARRHLEAGCAFCYGIYND